MIPLFENNSNTSAGAAADGTSPSSPLATSVSGSSSQDGILEISKMMLDGKIAQYSSGSSVIVEVSNLNKVKECYTEDTLQVSILLLSI